MTIYLPPSAIINTTSQSVDANTTMQTSLPDLPFENYGQAELRTDGTHSAPSVTPRRDPGTDLKTLTQWATFPIDIHQVIASATTHANLPSTQLDIGASTTRRYVENEERIRTHATVALHEPVEHVLGKLRVNGWFALPGGGNAAIVGDPDFSWITKLGGHPKVIVEYKTWWAADLQHIEDAFNGIRNDALSPQSLHALEQIYGYMTFNNNKFGILTNWQRALFLRRTETSERKTLEYYIIELGGSGPISMLKAWVGLVLLAEDDWFYASPTISSPPPDRNFGSSRTAWINRRKAVDSAHQDHMQPVNGVYECLALDFRLCHFDLSSARRGSNGCIVEARFLEKLPLKKRIICKIVDISRYHDTLDNEARAYAALQNLQGKVIPTLYGFYDVWEILRLLALEPVGHAITEGEQISPRLRMKMKAALRHIHAAGFIHGDIARRNFCRTARDEVFLVDLERCRPGNPLERDNEMNEVDGL